MTEKQLRKLVREQVKLVKEAMGAGTYGPPQDSDPEINEKIMDLVSAVVSNVGEYSGDDPSAGPMGQDTWDAQVAELEMKLEGELAALVNELLRQFHNGEMMF